MSDVTQVAVVAGATACTVSAIRAGLTLRLARLRAGIATTPQEYAMLEVASRKPQPKKAKAPAPIPFGL